MNKQIDSIIELFHSKKPTNYTLKNIRFEDDDSRWIIIVEFMEEKYVLKIAANDFTTKERVCGWVNIIAEYRKMGYYSPAIIKSLNGNYCEQIVFNDKKCIIWEEEYAQYNLRETLDKSVYTDTEGRYVYHDEVFEFLGKVAEKHFSNFPYKSGWVRLDGMSSNETTDEVAECVQTLDSLVRDNTPKFISRWEKILELFEKNKVKLGQIYNELPTSVFQADTFGDNLVLDRNGHFKGIIDYNLAGEEVVINMFLSTILFGYSYMRKPTSNPNVLPELNEETQNSIIDIVLNTFNYLKKYYTFSEKEIKAVPFLYKYISCIEYSKISAFEKYMNDESKLKLLFDFMEYELLREDIDFRSAMLR